MALVSFRKENTPLVTIKQTLCLAMCRGVLLHVLWGLSLNWEGQSWNCDLGGESKH